MGNPDQCGVSTISDGWFSVTAARADFDADCDVDLDDCALLQPYVRGVDEAPVGNCQECDLDDDVDVDLYDFRAFQITFDRP